jgi:hypothetical protein
MDFVCLIIVCNDQFLPLPKLSSGLLVAMVLFPYTKDGDATQGAKLLVLYTKDNNPNNKQP